MSALLRVVRPAPIVKNNFQLFHNSPVLNIVKSNVQRKSVNPFTLAGVTKHYELMPLVVIIGGGVIGLGIWSVYFCNTRNDLQFRKSPSYDPMDLKKPPVLKVVKTSDYRNYEQLSELDKIYQEMAAAEVELHENQEGK